MDSICGPVPWTGSIKIWTRSMDPLNLLPHINKDYSSVLITHQLNFPPHASSKIIFNYFQLFYMKAECKILKKKEAKKTLIQFQLVIF